MLLRKRAWDVMRSDFRSVSEKASVGEVISSLRKSMKAHPDEDFVLVLSETGFLKGGISVRDMLRSIEDTVLSDKNLSGVEETDWDNAFSRACTLSCSRSISEIMERRPPTLEPGEPLLVVVNLFVDTRSRWLVVEEGGRPIGVVLIGDVFREISREMVRE